MPWDHRPSPLKQCLSMNSSHAGIFSVYPGRTWVGWKSVSSMLASMFLIIFTFLMFSTHLRVKEFAGSCTRKEVIELSQPALCFHWETQFQICARSSSTWFFTCIRSLINQVNFVVQKKSLMRGNPCFVWCGHLCDWYILYFTEFTQRLSKTILFWLQECLGVQISMSEKWWGRISKKWWERPIWEVSGKLW